MTTALPRPLRAVTDPRDNDNDTTDTSETTAGDPVGPVPGPDTVAAIGRGPGVGMELVHVDPACLIFDVNVRSDVDLTKEFIGSIRDLGVLEPIKARRDADGGLRVLFGHRRALAAVQAGLGTVPVLAVDAGDDEKATAVLRIVEQLGENQHRTGLTDADEVRAHQELLNLGLTAGQVARRTHVPRKRVQATTRVAASAVAVEAMTRHQLGLEQAVAVAEFDDDPAAVDALTTAAGSDPGRFAHLLQQLRDARADAAARAAVTAELTGAGVRIVDQPEGALFGGRVRRLSELRSSPDTPPGTELTVDAHRGCPGHVAWVADRGWRDPAARAVAVYACDGWQGHGHADRYASPGTIGAGRVTGAMSQQQKAERREVIERNKAWDSAQAVRRDWLRAFLARRTPPRDAHRWIAATLAASGSDIRRAMDSGHTLAADLLGLMPASAARPDGKGWYPGSGRRPISDAAATASPARATTLTLGVLLAGREDATSRDTWRHPTAEARAYFTALRDWGYTLSDVEALVLTGPETSPRTDSDTGSSSGAGDEPAGDSGETTTSDPDPDGDRDPDGHGDPAQNQDAAVTEADDGPGVVRA